MRIRIERRIHADGKVFYAGDVVELAKYPELRRKLQEREREESLEKLMAMDGVKNASPARDKVVRSTYKTKHAVPAGDGE